MTAPEEIARLRGLLERATPGPWRTEQRDRDDMDGQRYNSEGPCLVMSPECGSHPVADTSANHTCGLAIEDNAALIVAMRNALPALLDDVERLQARVAELETLLLDMDGANNAARERIAELEDARASHERLLLALSMTDGTLRRVHGTPLRDLLVEWGIDEFWASSIDAALAPKETRARVLEEVVTCSECGASRRTIGPAKTGCVNPSCARAALGGGA